MKTFFFFFILIIFFFCIDNVKEILCANIKNTIGVFVYYVDLAKDPFGFSNDTSIYFTFCYKIDNNGNCYIYYSQKHSDHQNTFNLFQMQYINKFKYKIYNKK